MSTGQNTLLKVFFVKLCSMHRSMFISKKVDFQFLVEVLMISGNSIQGELIPEVLQSQMLRAAATSSGSPVYP